ncbi:MULTISPECIES: hypothetical protein [unclassified Candidatus Tisiphia]|uniref:hypothetical protein n=1 Tax=unclassified Candidatus Tisiphia TaxID=2996318 RepID=UPI00312CC1F8
MTDPINKNKLDSFLPMSKEEIKANLQDPGYRQKHGLDNSKTNSLGDINAALDKVAGLLEAAEKELKGVKQLKGLDKLQGEKAQNLLQDFKEGFDKASKDIKEYKEYNETVPGAPIRDFADQRSAEQYENSPIGRLEKFAKDQLKKIEKIFEEPVNYIKNNKILNAVVDVIKCLCKVVSTIVKSSLNNAIVVGEAAKSVVNLGSAIKNAAMGKGTQQSMAK